MSHFQSEQVEQRRPMLITCRSNWLEVQFEHVSCSSSTNPTPSIKSWGCIDGDCSNNDAASVCADTGLSKRDFSYASV